MANLPARKLKPEEEELERKRAELAQLEAELANRELELATFQAELTAFENHYIDVVGRRYAELDHLEAQIAEATARLQPEDKSAHEQAQAARARAQESAKAVGDIGQAGVRRDFKPSETLKKLYRKAAKAIHPDLATDEAEKARREKLMAEVNKAYAEGDEERIRAILREWESSPEQVRGEGPAAELVRTIRKIAQVENRLRTIETDINHLRRSDLFRLKIKTIEAASDGRDLVAEIARRLDDDIADARERLDHC